MNSLYCVLYFLFFLMCNVASKLISLNTSNWGLIREGHWLIKFYAPWCPACQNLKPTWEKLAQRADYLTISLAQVDVTVEPVLSGIFLITSLPTIYHVKDGVFRLYEADRDLTELSNFITRKSYENIDAVPWYKTPTAPHMLVLGWFMGLAVRIKDMHTYLTDTQGLPVWGSYAVLASTTLLLGLLLGFLIIVTCDFFLPPRAQAGRMFTGKSQRPIDNVDATDDDDNDDLPDSNQQNDLDAAADDNDSELDEDMGFSGDGDAVRKRMVHSVQL